MRKKNVLGEFHRLIHPMVYKRIHYRTKEILGMSMKMLESGDFFLRRGQRFSGVVR